MKEIKKEVIIPAHTTMRIIYEAIDGKQFDTMSSCKSYEEQLNIKNHPVVVTSIAMTDFVDDYPFTAYYIKNEDDWKFFINKICDNHFNGDTYKEYGEGWYLCQEIDGGDYHDYCNVYHAATYLAKLEKEFSKWSSEIHTMLNI